jgi:hypothetical protein
LRPVKQKIDHIYLLYIIRNYFAQIIKGIGKSLSAQGLQKQKKIKAKIKSFFSLGLSHACN